MTNSTSFTASAHAVRTAGFEVFVSPVLAEEMAAGLGAPERDPAEWHQSIGVARQACARIFRDGGRPADAIRAFGLSADAGDWSKAVTLIAQSLCGSAMRRAA